MRDLEGMNSGDASASSAEIQQLRAEVKQEIVGLRDKIRKLAALQQAMAAKTQTAKPKIQKPGMEPVFKAEGPGKKAIG